MSKLLDKNNDVNNKKPGVDQDPQKNTILSFIKNKLTPGFNLILTIVSLAISLVLIIYSWSLNQKQKQLQFYQQDIRNNQIIFEQSLSKINKESKMLGKELIKVNPQINRVTENEKKIDIINKKIDYFNQQFNEISSSSHTMWKIYEIEYLLQLSNQKLLLSYDINSAEKLLNHAYQILTSLNNYNLFSVKKSLAKDIMNLKTIPKINFDNLYLRLHNLSEKISEQVLSNPKFDYQIDFPQKKAQENQDDHSFKTNLNSKLEYAWSQFFTLFKIRKKQEKNLTYLISTDEEKRIKYSLQKLIDQAKIAMLLKQNSIYQSALLQAKEIITLFYQNPDHQFGFYINELNSLLKFNVQPNMPNMQITLDKLNALNSQNLSQQEQQTIKTNIEKPESTP